MDIKQYLASIMEALSPKQMAYADKLRDEGKGKTTLPDNVHDELFAKYNKGDTNAQRIILPTSSPVNESPYDEHIAKHLHKNGGWTIHDYKQGIATRKLVTKKGFVKTEEKSIGALLKETGGDDVHATVTREKSIRNNNGNLVRKNVDEHMSLTKIFNTDPIRQHTKNTNDDHQVVISRDPYDVAGMTSGRPWEDTSCMRLPYSYNEGDSGGAYHRRIAEDYAHHTMVAYLTHKGDDKAENPIARTLLKRFTNSQGHDIWRPETRPYGKGSDSFTNTVSKFAEKEMPGADGFSYHKQADLYDDDGRNHITGGVPASSFDSIPFAHKSRPTKIVSSKYNELEQFHTDNDEPSLHIIQTSFGKEHHIKAWHKNGALDNGEKPSLIHQVFDEDNNLIRQDDHIHKNGYLHSPRNGKVPSVTSTEYDNNGDVSGVTHQYHKFGRPHNSIIHGLAHIGFTDYNARGEKLVYGEHHTENDDEPSFFQADGNSTEKKWHSHGELIVSHSKSNHEDNKDHHYRYYGTYNKKIGGEVIGEDEYVHPNFKMKELPDGKKLLESRIHRKHHTFSILDGDRRKTISYDATSNSEDLTFDPQKESITSEQHWIKHDGNMTPHNGPNGEPAVFIKSGFDTRHEYRHYGELHHPTEPAYVNIERDSDNTPYSIRRRSYVNDSKTAAITNMPVGSLLEEHWDDHSTSKALHKVATVKDKDGSIYHVIRDVTHNATSTPPTYDENNFEKGLNGKLHSVEFRLHGEDGEREYNGKVFPHSLESITTQYDGSKRVLWRNGDYIEQHDQLAKQPYKIGRGLQARKMTDDGEIEIIPSSIGHEIQIRSKDKEGRRIATYAEIRKSGKVKSITHYDHYHDQIHVDPNNPEHDGLREIEERIKSGSYMKELNDHFKPNSGTFDIGKHTKWNSGEE